LFLARTLRGAHADGVGVEGEIVFPGLALNHRGERKRDDDGGGNGKGEQAVRLKEAQLPERFREERDQDRKLEVDLVCVDWAAQEEAKASKATDKRVRDSFTAHLASEELSSA